MVSMRQKAGEEPGNEPSLRKSIEECPPNSPVLIQAFINLTASVALLAEWFKFHREYNSMQQKAGVKPGNEGGKMVYA